MTQYRFSSKGWPEVRFVQTSLLVFISILILALNASILFFSEKGTQAISFYVYYSVSFCLLLFLVSYHKYFSAIFIYLFFGVVLGFFSEYAILSNGLVEHRDAFFNYDLDQAVFKKYMLGLASVFLTFLIYFLIPKNIGLDFNKFFREGDSIDCKSSSKFLSINLLAIIFSFAILLVFLDFASQSGGVINAITQRALGRENRIGSEIGAHHIFLINQSFMFCVVWGLINRGAFNSKLFWLVFFFLILLAFFVTGGRGALIGKLLIITTTYLLSGAFNIRAFFSIVLIGFVLISYQTTHRSLDSNELASTTFSEALSESIAGIGETFTEASRRGSENDSAIGVFLNVPHNLDYLFGYTYVSTAFIPIPSAVLPFDKPRAAGAHYVYSLTSRTDTAWPIGPVAEAYWNFSYFGVFIYAILMGVVLRLVNNSVEKSRFSSFSLLLFLIVSYRFTLSSDGLYAFTQMFVFSIFCYILISTFARLRLRRS